MIGSIAELNRERNNRKEPPIRLSIGLHYGQVVLGDIGLNRLEFAVIGTAVNAASRLETLTREYGCALVASDELVQRARAETGSSAPTFCISSKSQPGPFAASSNRWGYGRGITGDLMRSQSREPSPG